MNVPAETGMIQKYFAPLAGPDGLMLRDDAACLTPREGHDLVFTADTIVAGRHFFADDDAFDIAIKAITVNRSDLVAKGAMPVGYLLALSLPQKPDDDWMTRFSTGLGEQIEGLLLGGDTTRIDGPLTISVTAIGEVPRGKMVRRNGANAGDVLFLTGEIGTSAIGLKSIQDKAWASSCKLEQKQWRQIQNRYYAPTINRPDDYTKLIAQYASASLDVSDGLAIDLSRMCEASGTGAEIDLRQLPLAPKIKSMLEAGMIGHDELITGGDDYVALFAVPPEKAEQLEADTAAPPVFRIGKMQSATKGIKYRKSFWKSLSLDGKTGYDHFL